MKTWKITHSRELAFLSTLVGFQSSERLTKGSRLVNSHRQVSSYFQLFRRWMSPFRKCLSRVFGSLNHTLDLSWFQNYCDAPFMCVIGFPPFFFSRFPHKIDSCCQLHLESIWIDSLMSFLCWIMTKDPRTNNKLEMMLPTKLPFTTFVSRWANWLTDDGTLPTVVEILICLWIFSRI